MCDFSLHNVRSRPAKVGDKLTTRDFGTDTRGGLQHRNRQTRRSTFCQGRSCRFTASLSETDAPEKQ
jgi:hypothetical protein